MEAILVTRADDDHKGKSVHIYRFQGQAWAFVAHADDPGLDYLVLPTGETVEVYEPFGNQTPNRVPEALWAQYMEDCANCTYPS